MEVFRDVEQQLCPCYEEYQEFQKLVGLKDSGLAVYCHRPRTEDDDDIRQAEAVESAVNATRDVFILHNKKNVKITSSELTSELEKENISCPRCRKTFEHAQELLQEVKSIDRKIVMGICDHCRKKAQGSKIPFCSCDKILKKFISVKGEKKEDTKAFFKTLPIKTGHLGKDTMVKKQNAYSNLQINRDLRMPAFRHEPKVQQMFSHTHFKSEDTELTETNLKEGYVKQAVAFIQPIELVTTSSAHTPYESKNISTIIPGTSLVDSETTFLEISVGVKELPRPSLKDRKQEEIFEDRPSMDAKLALKIRHDLSLRQMMRLDKDSVAPYSISKRPDIYEIPKIAPWAQKEPTSKYHVESEMDIKIAKLEHDHRPRGTRVYPRKADKYHHDKMKRRLYDSKGPKTVKKLEDRYIAEEGLKLQRRVDKSSHKEKKPKQQHLKAKSKSEPTETVASVLKRKYSFFFPKVIEKEEKQVIVDVSSSYLIKDTQEKIRLQVEKERQEEEHQKKLIQAQKKKLAEEKILQAEEKKKKAVEDQKKYEEEQRKSYSEQKINEEEQKNLAGHKTYSEKDLESKLVDKEKKQDKPRSDIKYGLSENNKMDVKVKPGDDEVTEKGSKDLKSGIEQKDKRRKNEVSKTSKKESSIALKEAGLQKLHAENLKEKQESLKKKEQSGTKLKEKLDEISEKAKTDLNAKLKQEDKGVEKKQKIKPEKEDPDKKVQREERDNANIKKQKQQLREKKGPQKAQVAKDKEEMDARLLDDLNAKLVQEDKGVGKRQKNQPEKEDPDKNLQREEIDNQNLKKQIEQLRKEKKAQKGAKDKEEIDARLLDDLNAKLEREDKGVAKKQKIKPEKEDPDKKLQREKLDNENLKKQKEQIRKEKEAQKAQVGNDKENIDARLLDDLNAKLKQEDKGVGKKQKIKPEKEDPDKKLQREEIDNQNLKKQMEQLRKEKKAQKGAKDKEEIDARLLDDLNAKLEREDKGVAKKQKIKPEKEDPDKKLQREEIDNQNLQKQMEQLRKEKKAQKGAKDKEEIDARLLDDLNAKLEREDKGVAKKQKIKPEKEDPDKKLQREEIHNQNLKKQMEQLRKEKKAQKGAKDKEEIDARLLDNLNAKLEREDKGVAKKQKIKPEKEDADKKLQREKLDNENLKKQMEQLRKEKETQKVQVAKNKEEIDARSQKGKASKNKRDASDDITVSLSNIQKSFKKETPGKEEILKVKQGKGQGLESKTLKRKSSISLIEASELQKLQAEHLKEKQQRLKNKEQLEYEAKRAKAKEETERKEKRDLFGTRHIKMKKERSDEYLELVKLKQAKKMGLYDSNQNLWIHIGNHQLVKSPFCPFCPNSDLELDVLSLEYKNNLTTHKTDIIIGEKIFKNRPRLESIKEPEGVPIIFQKKFSVEFDKQLKQTMQIIPQETEPEQKQILLTKKEPGKGGIRYALSDRTFIEKGWTMLPTEKVVRKMNVYRMRPTHPEHNWFKHNKDKQLMNYDTGERLAEFDDNGRGRWYYRNGRLALDYYDAEETNAQQRIVVYSSGEPDERGRTHPITILATFDYLGNGIVFDHAGKIRLKYNQTEGVVLDRGIGPVSHWQWHSLNDPPVLQQVMIDTQMALKDPNILQLESATEITKPANEEMLAIEFDNFIKEKSKKLTQKFKPFQIRMKALKINEHFSLKILDQATIYLIFRDGLTNLKLNIGMKLDHQEIVDTDTAEVGKVSNTLERFPARSDSLATLQRTVAHAQRYERQHTKRGRWLQPPEPCASAERLIAAASPPMRFPLSTVPMGSSSSTGYKYSRKPTNNLYYDTRLSC